MEGYRILTEFFGRDKSPVIPSQKEFEGLAKRIKHVYGKVQSISVDT